jgi:hypothetical protein
MLAPLDRDFVVGASSAVSGSVPAVRRQAAHKPSAASGGSVRPQFGHVPVARRVCSSMGQSDRNGEHCYQERAKRRGIQNSEF